MDIATLSKQIKAAFPLLPSPKISLYQAQLLDVTLSRKIDQAEWMAAGARDSGRTWGDYRESELMACDAALYHQDEIGFVYYLPAFLLMALRQLAVAGIPRVEEKIFPALFAITHFSGYSLSRFARFTPEQVTAVRNFLEFVASGPGTSAEDARVALELYWNTDRAGKFLILPE